jgi:hypothetical protein
LQIEEVQRFVVVHAQILLNQYKNFPGKAIRESAFAAGLKSQMELRRHAKLYMKPVKQGRASKSRSNSNPMRDRASMRAAPMPATATIMVRAIWQDYCPSSAATEGMCFPPLYLLCSATLSMLTPISWTAAQSTFLIQFEIGFQQKTSCDMTCYNQYHLLEFLILGP